jgi:hypothetical protein
VPRAAPFQPFGHLAVACIRPRVAARRASDLRSTLYDRLRRQTTYLGKFSEKHVEGSDYLAWVVDVDEGCAFSVELWDSVLAQLRQRYAVRG